MPPKMFIKRRVFCMFYLLILVKCSFASEEEYRLLQDLRENYDRVERPVQNHSDPVDVNLRIILQQIVDVDEKNQMLTLVVWMQFTWMDYKMRWSPEEYSGIKDVMLPSDALWKPDILLFNSADENFDARFPVNIVVQHTGHVLQAPPVIIKSSCKIDITWFPFDEQMCFLKFGSWTYTGSKLRLFIDDNGLKGGVNKIDLTYFVHNGEWDLIATPARRIVSIFQDEPYNEIYFYLHIRRKTIYYGMNWIIPSVLFLLSNVLGFTMPSECGEKITLQTTNLLSVTVFLGMVADVTPPTSVPIIAAFFSISMVILGSSIIFTLLIINVHFRSPRTHKMSPWVRTAFLEWLPWLLLMNRPGKQFKKPKKKKSKNKKESFVDSISASRIVSRIDSVNLSIGASAVQRQARVGIIPSSMSNDGSARKQFRTYLPEKQALLSRVQVSETKLLPLESTDSLLFSTCGLRRPLLQETKSTSLKPNENPTSKAQLSKDYSKSEISLLLKKTLVELSDYLQMSQQKMDEEEEEEEAKADWRFMAMALDRACLFFYALLSGFIPIWMFMSTPSPSEPPDFVKSLIGDNNSTLSTQVFQ